MTRPVFTGCLNCLWLPTCATSYQPSCFKRCMTSRLDIRHDTHFLHTCQVGIYRISAAILDRVLERGRFIYLDGRLGERAISTCRLWATFQSSPKNRLDNYPLRGVAHIVFPYLALGKFWISHERKHRNANLGVIVLVVARHNGFWYKPRYCVIPDTSIGLLRKLAAQFCFWERDALGAQLPITIACKASQVGT